MRGISRTSKMQRARGHPGKVKARVFGETADKASTLRIFTVSCLSRLIGFARRISGAKAIKFTKTKLFLRSFQESIAIGVFRRSEILHAVEQSYGDAPEFYAPENYVTQVENELLPTLEELASGKQLLDLYAGQGREAEIFAEAGYNVVCVDRVSESVELGRKRAAGKPFKATFLVADIEDPAWQPPTEEWDVVYTSLWMLSTIPNREHRAVWLERLQSFGNENSLFVVSATLRRNEKLASLRHVWTRILRVLSFNSREIEFGDYFSSGIFWHEFLDKEVRDEINAAGFEILADYESHDKNVPTCNFYFLRRRHGAK